MLKKYNIQAILETFDQKQSQSTMKQEVDENTKSKGSYEISTNTVGVSDEKAEVTEQTNKEDCVSEESSHIKSKEEEQVTQNEEESHRIEKNCDKIT